MKIIYSIPKDSNQKKILNLLYKTYFKDINIEKVWTKNKKDFFIQQVLLLHKLPFRFLQTSTSIQHVSLTNDVFKIHYFPFHNFSSYTLIISFCITTKASSIIKTQTVNSYPLKSIGSDHIILLIKNHVQPRNRKIKPKIPCTEIKLLYLILYPIFAVLFKPKCNVCHSIHSTFSTIYTFIKTTMKALPSMSTIPILRTFPIKINTASFSILFTPIIQLSLYYIVCMSI